MKPANHKEFENIWDNFRDGTFEDIILARATKLRNVKGKGEKMHVLDELVNYSKRYLERLITGR